MALVDHLEQLFDAADWHVLDAPLEVDSLNPADCRVVMVMHAGVEVQHDRRGLRPMALLSMYINIETEDALEAEFHAIYELLRNTAVPLSIQRTPTQDRPGESGSGQFWAHFIITVVSVHAS